MMIGDGLDQRLTLNWDWLELEILRRPRRDSGAWVEMQMRAIIEGRVNLIKAPYDLLPNDNVITARLSHAAFFQSTSPRDRNRENENSCPCVLL